MRTIAFVIPWYGETIGGGAEAACRSFVKLLAARGATVEVMTTCVRDFSSDWSVDHHPPGVSIEGAITVRRFPVRARNTSAFDAINARLIEGNPIDSTQEEVFFREMVNSPALYDYIAARRDTHSFVFLPYMFGTTVYGIAAAAGRGWIMPCLHDESYAYLPTIRRTLLSAAGLFFLSSEEKRLAERICGVGLPDSQVVGVPLDCDCPSDGDRFTQRYGLKDYLLYAGRTDAGKNAELLAEHHGRLQAELPGVSLVYIGSRTPPVHSGHRQFALGYLPEQDKRDCFAAALATCVPSRVESFSIVLMESWLAGRPVIVNAACAVTSTFCQEAGGGLSFSEYDEFAEIVRYLQEHPRVAARMGEQGRRYVLANFTPDRVGDRLLKKLSEVHR